MPDGYFGRAEAGTTRLVRSASKAFSAGGDEKSGCYGNFMVFVKPFLKEHGFRSVPLHPFRGNRFNIFFFNAARIYFLQTEMKAFLTKHGAGNKLLKAVQKDLEVPEFVAGLKCLGLINKLLTSPLWRTIEDENVSIVDMNVQYMDFVAVIEEASLNVRSFMKGEIGFGTSFKKDIIWDKLMEPSEVDGVCEVMLDYDFSKGYHMAIRNPFVCHL